MPYGKAFSKEKDLSAEIIRLRSEVESLSSELKAKKEGHLLKRRSLLSQKLELDAELQRSSLLNEQLSQKIEKIKVLLENSEKNSQTFRPVFLEKSKSLKLLIKKGLPFRLVDRLKDVEKIEKLYEEKMIGEDKALLRLDQKIKDELRITRENGVYRQIIKIGDKEFLADVLKIGMVFLFFKTDEGKYGKAVRGEAGWSFKEYNQKEDILRLEYIYDNMKKNVRTGFFELPSLKLDFQ